MWPPAVRLQNPEMQCLYYAIRSSPMIPLLGICHRGAKLRADTCYTISLISALNSLMYVYFISPAGPWY